MAKISTYPFPTTPSLSDYVIGTDASDSLETKNFMISDILSLSGSSVYVPYTGATQDVDLGPYTLSTGEIYLSGPLHVASGSEGTSGQILISQGPGLPPAWDDISNVLPAAVYGSFYDDTDQTVAIGGIAAMKYNTTVTSSGVSIVNDLSGKPTRITVSNSGMYNIQFSAQLYRTSGGGGGPHQAIIWLRKNGIDIPNSSTHVTFQSNNAYLVAAWNFFEYLNAGQYVEIMWTQDDAIEITHDPANLVVPYPAVPSVILTVNKIS